MLSFHLNDSFVAEFAGKQPKWGPVGYVTYKRTYARGLDRIHARHSELAKTHNLVGSEEFWLTLTRAVEGSFSIQKNHCLSLRLPWSEKIAQRKAQEMFRLMWDFKFLPPGRGLWMMGAPIVDKLGGGALNNCGFASTKDIATDLAGPFCFLMDFSMLGVGIGFDTRGAGTTKLVAPKREGTQTIPDTREGWVETLRTVLNAFAGLGTLPAFDYSLIRPSGTPILGFGGTASGPEPLIKMIEDVILLLEATVETPVSSSAIVDVMNMIGRCVVAGNVRRSAEIAFGDPDDEAFLELKDADKNAAALSSHRWASNNSIFAKVGQKYAAAAKRTSKNGEPGYAWLENAQRYGRMIDPPNDKDAKALGANPCNEQTLHDRELCNLVETFPFNHNTIKEYRRTLKFAYLYAKSVTLVPTHDARTNAVTMANRRIGCSMSGVVQAIAKFGYRGFVDLCDDGYAYIQELDQEYSNWLCIPRSIKTTSVKPSGTISLLPQATPGMHFAQAEHYWRVIRFATDSPMIPALKRAGYMCIDIDPAKEPNTTAVYFPVKEEGFERGVADVSMWEQLEIAAMLQGHWADNQVSATITFDRKTEGDQIARALEVYERRLKGISFLPKEDHGYEHAPYQPISKSGYEAAIENIGTLDLSGTKTEVVDDFCDGGKCEIPVRNLEHGQPLNG